MTSSNGVLSSELQVRVSMSNVHNSGNFISLHSPQSMPLDLWYFCIYICICKCFCKLSYPTFTIRAISSLTILHRLTLTIQPSKYVLLPYVYFCIFVFVIKIIQHHVQSAEIWQFYLAANNPAITSKYSHPRCVFFAIYICICICNCTFYVHVHNSGYFVLTGLRLRSSNSSQNMANVITLTIQASYLKI